MDEPVKTTSQAAEQPQERPFTLWLKRLGLAGFLFYLVKGLLWIIIPALMAKRCM
jgi:hypothetical protein